MAQIPFELAAQRSASLPTSSNRSRDYTIVIPIVEATKVGPLIELASALVPLPADDGATATGDSRVVLLRVVEVPAELAMSVAATPARHVRQSLGRLQRLQRPPNVELRTTVRVSRESWEGVVEAAEQEQANLILIPWQEWVGEDAATSGIWQVLRNAPCDVAVARPSPLVDIHQVLVPVRGGPHAALALHLAAALAERAGANVTTLHVERTDLTAEQQEREHEEFAAIMEVVPMAVRDRISARTVHAPGNDVAAALLAEATRHQLLVMGAPAGAPGAPFQLGPIAERVLGATTSGVVVVRTRLPGTATHEQWAPLYVDAEISPLPRTSPSISAVVDKWFAENTFDSAEFEKIDELVRLKKQQGVTISVGLPALNEEETVGAVIRSVKADLVDRFPLIDELVLIDSQSTDRTREIAAELGIRVVIHQEILPEMGSVSGKGEALWKSLHVLRGDIVAWIDTDIRNSHPRFVYGLLGPLLKEPRIQYVKGFYKRPIKSGHRILSTGGGRVTELMARPLLNSFYPELSGLIQPLAGEYAGRRSVLERLPFFTGYGVEIGMLIDLLDHLGLQAIGQVDLKRRVHRNQGLPSLSRMAFTILQVVLRRQEQRGRLDLRAELATTMKLIQHSKDHFHVDERELVDHERPPMISVPAYRQQRGLET